MPVVTRRSKAAGEVHPPAVLNSSSQPEDTSATGRLSDLQAEIIGGSDYVTAASETRLSATATSSPLSNAKQAALDAAAKAPARARKSVARAAEKLLDFSDLPDYLQDNEFIVSHYRPPDKGLRQSVRTLFGWHNETGNVWTHLLGFLLFAGLTAYIATRPPIPLAFSEQQVDTLWSSVSGQLSDLRSTLGHNLHSLSDGIQAKLHLHSLQEALAAKLPSLRHRSASDSAIAAAAAVTNLVDTAAAAVVHSVSGSSSHHSLLERLQHAWSQLVHVHLFSSVSEVLAWPTPRWPTYVFMGGAMTCLLLSSICHLLGCCQRHVHRLIWRVDYSGIAILIVTSFYPPIYYGFLCQPAWRTFYLVSTTAMGVGVVCVSLMERFQSIPWRTFRAGMFAALGLWGLVPVLHMCYTQGHVWAVKQAMVYDIIMGAVYLSGAAIYAARIPERWMPGRFDIAASSHQIFHVAVVSAALIHYNAVKLLLEWRDASGGCAAPVLAGPVKQVLHELQSAGQPLHSLEQVWETMSRFAVEHFGLHSVST